LALQKFASTTELKNECHKCRQVATLLIVKARHIAYRVGTASRSTLAKQKGALTHAKRAHQLNKKSSS